MRRESRNRNKKDSYTSIWVTGVVLVVAITTFIITFIVYSNQLEDDIYSWDSKYLAQYNDVMEEENSVNEETASASSSIGKTIEESRDNENEEKETLETGNRKTEATQVSSNTQVTIKEEKDPTFVKPIEGEILKEYAKDSLVYSETLKEWITHLGIDIKAERATVVKSAAAGTVKYIKNDPRYGLTIIIEHVNGFETRYANLLTTEFVAEGEKVEAGQTIGTVGDSAIYEIVDESHLHFEILKDSESLNPGQYIDF